MTSYFVGLSWHSDCRRVCKPLFVHYMLAALNSTAWWKYYVLGTGIIHAYLDTTCSHPVTIPPRTDERTETITHQSHVIEAILSCVAQTLDLYWLNLKCGPSDAHLTCSFCVDPAFSVLVWNLVNRGVGQVFNHKDGLEAPIYQPGSRDGRLFTLRILSESICLLKMYNFCSVVPYWVC